MSATAGIIGRRIDFAPRKYTIPPFVTVFARLANKSAKIKF